MPSLLSWLALACIPVLALASPVQTEAMSHVEPRGSKYDINALNREFLGIYWDSAAETCTDEEMEIIIGSTRKAVEIMAFAVDAGGSQRLRLGIGTLSRNLMTNWKTHGQETLTSGKISSVRPLKVLF